MKCNHSDCFTCPYPDCIADVHDSAKKCGRKKLPADEKAKRKRAYGKVYYERNKAKFHEVYMARSEGKVKRRYKKAESLERWRDD